MQITAVHHIAIICADYGRSRRFYTEVLGFPVLRELWRAERQSWKLDLLVNGLYQIELFSFPQPPARMTQPEACGLRHLALAVPDLDAAVAELRAKGVPVEAIRLDGQTGKRFAFFADPDGLPLELYES